MVLGYVMFLPVMTRYRIIDCTLYQEIVIVRLSFSLYSWKNARFFVFSLVDQ